MNLLHLFYFLKSKPKCSNCLLNLLAILNLITNNVNPTYKNDTFAEKKDKS